MTDIKIPQVNFESARLMHQTMGREDKFIAHEHICRSPFIKKILYDRSHGICPICKRQIISINDSIVHHQTYDIFCQFLSPVNPEIKVFDPRPNGKFYSTCPNCEVCYFNPSHMDYSERCINNLVLLCSQDCHNLLHQK